MTIRTPLAILILLLCSLQQAESQGNMDSLIDRFFTGRQQFQDTFHAYVDSINLKFAEYLAKSWEQFTIESPIERPGKPEPPTLPVYVPDDEPAQETIIIQPAQTDTVRIEPASQKNDMQTSETAANSNTRLYNFFGTSVALNPVRGYETRLTRIDERQVANYWIQLSKTNYPDFINGLNNNQSVLKLGCWGMYRLILEWANVHFTGQQENEKAVFIVFVLNQAGYKAKLGLVRNSLVVLASFRNAIYGKSYIWDGSDRYYILSEQIINGHISSYKLNYERAVSHINLNTGLIPNLADHTRSTQRNFRDKVYSFKYNQNLVDYYHTFPQTDLEVYANIPFSAMARESMESELANDLKGKSATEKLKFLLALIQYGFEYKTDEDQFGYEKYAFAEETLHYPYSDCEDRAIVFCRMVKIFCGLDTLILDYPTHVAAAVKSNEPGDAIIYNNERYIVCDPSYIGASIAKTMKGQDNSKARIVVVR